MGALNLDNFHDELKLILGRNPGVTLMTRWVNYGLLDIASSVDLNKLDDAESPVTVNTSDQVTITNSAEALVVKMVYDTTNDFKLDWLQLADLYSIPKTAGEPKFWTRDRNSIKLRPVPDGAYTMLVLIKNAPTRLSALADQTEISQIWDFPILCFAAAHGFNAIGEPDRGQYWKNEAVNYIMTRLTEEKFENELSGLATSYAQRLGQGQMVEGQ